ncbi:MAG: C25 family cysteine peptidase [Deltaproteobacteria bacterium]|nr:C25 family cysteine peptidase [Deltaproteobacteria bacterium]
MIDLGVSVVPNNAIVDINRMSSYDTTIPSLSQTDYLIITNGLFANGAKSIADQKSREGYHPTIVDVERVYDHYSYGEVEARAIQNFVRDVWSTGNKRLKYLLLIGGDTFDPNNYLGLDQISFIPSLVAMDQYGSRIPSENLYVDMNDDGIPDIAIGRLPVSTAEQMDIVAYKIVNQNSLLAMGSGSQLFAVDNQGASDDPSFRDMAEPIAASLPHGKTVTWADVGLGAAAAQSTLFNGLMDGMEAVHYFGHGGYTIWSDDGLLSVSSVDKLANSGVGTVIFTWTCSVQDFQYHLGPCINEALLLVPDGGAVATVGPAGVTTTDTQEMLYSQLYLNLTKGMTLGQAIQQAKATALTSSKLAQPAVDGWTLLGDPSLCLNWGGSSKGCAATKK